MKTENGENRFYRKTRLARLFHVSKFVYCILNSGETVRDHGVLAGAKINRIESIEYADGTAALADKAYYKRRH